MPELGDAENAGGPTPRAFGYTRASLPAALRRIKALPPHARRGGRALYRADWPFSARGDSPLVLDWRGCPLRKGSALEKRIPLHIRNTPLFVQGKIAAAVDQSFPGGFAGDCTV